MNNDDNLDLLDLDDGTSMDSLPDAVPFNAPRPKKPWLLLGLGAVIIILATYIIISTIRDDSSSSMEVDLDAPIVLTEEQQVPVSVDTVEVKNVEIQKAEPIVVPAKKSVPEVEKVAEKPAQKTSVKPVVKQEPKEEPVKASAGVPVRVIEDRKEVTFNPEKETVQQPVRKQQTKPVATNQAKKQVSQAPAKSNWYVQFGSYSTRALAESAEKKIRAGHQSLFSGKQFVILAAVLPNGNTTYRLRIGFTTSNEANGFCRNAKSDGVDCYVAK